MPRARGWAAHRPDTTDSADTSRHVTRPSPQAAGSRPGWGLGSSQGGLPLRQLQPGQLQPKPLRAPHPPSAAALAKPRAPQPQLWAGPAAPLDAGTAAADPGLTRPPPSSPPAPVPAPRSLRSLPPAGAGRAGRSECRPAGRRTLRRRAARCSRSLQPLAVSFALQPVPRSRTAAALLPYQGKTHRTRKAARVLRAFRFSLAKTWSVKLDFTRAGRKQSACRVRGEVNNPKFSGG